MKRIAPHEPEAELLSAEDVNKDVASLSSALAEARLRTSIERSQRCLAQFEQRYGVDTAHFLQEMTAEDLKGSDVEYVEWAGEARLLEGLEAELMKLEKGTCPKSKMRLACSNNQVLPIPPESLLCESSSD